MELHPCDRPFQELLPRFLAGGWSGLFLLLLLLGVGIGCKSTSPDGTKTSGGVLIEGASLAEIRRACITVFVGAGYEVRESHGRDVTFDRRGSTMNDLVYGGWLSHKTWVRLKLRIEDLPTGANLLTCTQYVVRARDDTVFEEEHKTIGSGRGANLKLMEQAKAECLKLRSPASGDTKSSAASE